MHDNILALPHQEDIMKGELTTRLVLAYQLFMLIDDCHADASVVTSRGYDEEGHDV